MEDESDHDLLRLRAQLREHPAYATWKAKASQIGTPLTDEERAVKEQHCDVVAEMRQREQSRRIDQFLERAVDQFLARAEAAGAVAATAVAGAADAGRDRPRPLFPASTSFRRGKDSSGQPPGSPRSKSFEKTPTRNVILEEFHVEAELEPGAADFTEDILTMLPSPGERASEEAAAPPAMTLVRAMESPFGSYEEGGAAGGAGDTAGQPQGPAAVPGAVPAPPPPGKLEVSRTGPEASAPRGGEGAAGGGAQSGASSNGFDSNADPDGKHSIRSNVRASMQAVEAPRFVLHPTDSFFRRNWDLAMSVIIMYIALYLPFQVAFKAEMHAVHYGFDQMLDFLFIIDIILNFRTGFVKTNGTVEMQPRPIFWEYLTTWFPVDFVSAIPFDLIFMIIEEFQPGGGDSDDDGGGGGVKSVVEFNKIVRLLKMARILKILRVLRLGRILRRVTKMLGISLGSITVAKFFMNVFLSSHWGACIWYWIGTQEGTPNWVTYMIDEGYSFKTVSNQYVISLYHSVMTMSTLGSPIVPITDVERVVTIIAMLVGVCFFAFGITNMCALVFTLDFEETAYRRILDLMNEYCSANHLSKETRIKCREHLDFMHGQHHFVDDSFVLQYLSPELASEVQMEVHRKLFFQLSSASVLASLSDDFLLAICDKFRADYYMPGELIFTRGDVCRHMYYVESGRMVLLAGEAAGPGAEPDEAGEAVDSGEFYGESSLSAPHLHRRSGRAGKLLPCELRLISRRAVEEEVMPYLRGNHANFKREWNAAVSQEQAKITSLAQAAKTILHDNFVNKSEVLRDNPDRAGYSLDDHGKTAQISTMFGHTVKVKNRRQSTVAGSALDLVVLEETGNQQAS